MNIESLKYRVRSFADGDDALTMQCDELMGKLAVRNRFNLEAILDVRSVDLHTRDISEYEYGTDYELGSCFKNDEDSPDELATQEAVEDRIAELEEAQKKIRSKTKRMDVESVIEGWKRALDDPTYDEIFWNRIWRPFGDDINQEIARDLGFGIITFDNDHDSNLTYIGLQGCGQDMTPALMAYIALVHKVVDPEHVHYLTRPDDVQWCRHIIGDTMLIRVYHALGGLPAMILCDLGRDRRKINGENAPSLTAKAKAYARQHKVKIPRPSKKGPAYEWVERFKCQNA